MAAWQELNGPGWFLQDEGQLHGHVTCVAYCSAILVSLRLSPEIMNNYETGGLLGLVSYIASHAGG